MPVFLIKLNIMKTKLLFVVVAAITMAACTSTPKTKTFKVNVNLANADGKTVYLQKDGQTLDSTVIANWDAVFETPVCDDNEMYGIMLKGWRRPFAFFTDNSDVTLEGDAQSPNAIVVKGSESQDRLNTFTKGFMAFDANLDAIGKKIAEAKKAGDQTLTGQLQSEYDIEEEKQKA